MGFFNICTKRIIEYSDKAFSECAEAWFMEWLEDNWDVEVFMSEDKIEIMDVDLFSERVEGANPPEDIRDEVMALFRECVRNGRKLGCIYIDIFR